MTHNLPEMERTIRRFLTGELTVRAFEQIMSRDYRRSGVAAREAVIAYLYRTENEK